MVVVTEVESPLENNALIQENDDDYEELDDHVVDELEDLDIEDESILERLAALVDIVPPVARAHLSNAVSSGINNTFGALRTIGSGVWVLVTGAFLVAVPVAFELEREQAIIQQEAHRVGQEAPAPEK